MSPYLSSRRIDRSLTLASSRLRAKDDRLRAKPKIALYYRKNCNLEREPLCFSDVVCRLFSRASTRSNDAHCIVLLAMCSTPRLYYIYIYISPSRFVEVCTGRGP